MDDEIGYSSDMYDQLPFYDGTDIYNSDFARLIEENREDEILDAFNVEHLQEIPPASRIFDLAQLDNKDIDSISFYSSYDVTKFRDKYNEEIIYSQPVCDVPFLNYRLNSAKENNETEIQHESIKNQQIDEENQNIAINKIDKSQNIHKSLSPQENEGRILTSANSLHIAESNNNQRIEEEADYDRIKSDFRTVQIYGENIKCYRCREFYDKNLLFLYKSKYICLYCSKSVKDIRQLKDWEINQSEISKRCYRCKCTKSIRRFKVDKAICSYCSLKKKHVYMLKKSK